MPPLGKSNHLASPKKLPGQCLLSINTLIVISSTIECFHEGSKGEPVKHTGGKIKTMFFMWVQSPGMAVGLWCDPTWNHTHIVYSLYVIYNVCLSFMSRLPCWTIATGLLKMPYSYPNTFRNNPSMSTSTVYRLKVWSNLLVYHIKFKGVKADCKRSTSFFFFFFLFFFPDEQSWN